MDYKQYCKLVVFLIMACCSELGAQVIQSPNWEVLETMEYLNNELKPLTGTSSSTWCRSGSRSKLEEDEFGYVIVRSLGSQADQYIGFTELPFQYRNQESKYAIRFTSSGALYFYKDGVSDGIFFTGSGGVNLEDCYVKLSKESDAIRVYVKGPGDSDFVLKKETLISSNTYMPMWIYSNMFGNAKGFGEIKTNMPDEQHPVFWNSRETAGVRDFGSSYDQYGFAASNNNWKGGGILSEQQLQAGENGSISYIADQSQSTSYWLGLSSANGLDRLEQLDYGFEFMTDGTLKVISNGIVEVQSTFIVGTTRKARIIINEGLIHFYYGNTELHVEALSNLSLEFRVGLLFGDENQAIEHVKTSIPLPTPEWDIQDEVSFIDGESNVFKTNPNQGWNSGIASTALSVDRDNEIYFEVINTDRFYKFVGIPKDPTDMNSISDFRYGFLIGNDGNKITIFNTDDSNVTTSFLFDIRDPDGDGDDVTNSAYYIYGNKMAIRINKAKIYFYYNNILVHQDDYTYSYLVHFGAMLFEENSSFRLLRYGVNDGFNEMKSPNWTYVTGVKRYLDSGLIKEGIPDGLSNSISLAENVFVEGELTSVSFNGFGGDGIKRFGLVRETYPDVSGNYEYYYEVDNSLNLKLHVDNGSILNFGTIASNDTLSIETIKGNIYFKKNGRYLEAVGTYDSSSSNLRLFAQIEKDGGFIESIKTSANGEPGIVQWNNNNEYEFDFSTQDLSTSSGWEDSGGLSSNWTLPETTSGILSWNNIASNKDYYVGFSHKKKPNSLDDIDFSYKVHDDGVLEVYEYGVLKQLIAVPTITLSDLLEVERRNDRILYLWNDIVVYESDILSSDKLFPAVYASDDSQSLPKVKFSLEESPAKWIDKDDLEYDANYKNMLCTSTATGWSGVATSANRLKTGESSYINFRVGQQTGKEKAIALTAVTDNPSNDPDLKDYVFSFDDKVHIYENGVQEYVSASGAFNEGDIFSINKVDAGSGNYAIRYMQNNIVLRTVSMSSDFELMATAQLAEENAALYDINIGFKNIALPSTGGSPYMEVKRTATETYQKSEGQLLLKLDESFVYSDVEELSYKIYNASKKELFCYSAPDLDHLGGRRFVLDTSSFCTGTEGLESGSYYTLEIINKKNERRYMRFKYVIPS